VREQRRVEEPLAPGDARADGLDQERPQDERVEKRHCESRREAERAGFRMLLSGEEDIEVVAEASNGLDAVSQAARFHPAAC
jgi:hypothetical protein